MPSYWRTIHKTRSIQETKGRKWGFWDVIQWEKSKVPREPTQNEKLGCTQNTDRCLPIECRGTGFYQCPLSESARALLRAARALGLSTCTELLVQYKLNNQNNTECPSGISSPSDRVNPPCKNTKYASTGVPLMREMYVDHAQPTRHADRLSLGKIYMYRSILFITQIGSLGKRYMYRPV